MIITKDNISEVEIDQKLFIYDHGSRYNGIFLGVFDIGLPESDPHYLVYSGNLDFPLLMFKVENEIKATFGQKIMTTEVEDDASAREIVMAKNLRNYNASGGITSIPVPKKYSDLYIEYFGHTGIFSYTF